ncbi:MAG: hypothetical protein KJO91_10865 [Gammaproteobacteria bacterium]|nr:hypothetical protein [Gammaproteobacteria bacterium]
MTSNESSNPYSEGYELYMDGKKAFTMGLPFGANPYSEEDELAKHEAWANGWSYTQMLAHRGTDI